MRNVLAGAALGVAAMLAGAPGAQAANPCVSATPTSASYADPAGDAAGLGPDIVSVDLALSGDCVLSVSLGLSGGQSADDIYRVYLDTDNDRTTGDRNGPFPGADYAVDRRPGDLPWLLHFQGGSFVLVKSVPSYGSTGGQVTLNDLGASIGVPFRVAGSTVRATPNGGASADRAPEPGVALFSFPFSYTDGLPPAPPAPPAPPPAAPAPAPAAPAPPAPAPPAPAPPAGASKPKRCVVPALRGLDPGAAKQRLVAAGCTAGRVTTATTASSLYVGRVLRYSPVAGRTLPSGARVDLVIGRPKPKPKSRKSGRSGRTPGGS